MFSRVLLSSDSPPWPTIKIFDKYSLLRFDSITADLFEKYLETAIEESVTSTGDPDLRNQKVSVHSCIC